MRKAETEPLTIFLIAFILIALVAAITFIFFRYISNPQNASLVQEENFGESTGSLFRVEEIRNGEVYIRNMGSSEISNISLRVYIDNSPVGYSMISDVGKGGVGTLRVSGLSGFSLGDHNLKMTGRGFGVEEKVLIVKNTANSVLFLELNEGSGESFSDISDYRNDPFCEPGKCPSWTGGINGSALSFEPDNENYLITPVWEGFPQGGQEITYSAWIYIQDNRASVIIVGFPNADDTALMIDNGYVSLAVYSDTVRKYTNPVPLDMRKWYFVQGSYENRNIHVYVNDIGQHWYDVPYIPRGSQEDRIIIGSYSPSQYFFHGRIDDVRVYNKYLSQYDNVTMILR